MNNITINLNTNSVVRINEKITIPLRAKWSIGIGSRLFSNGRGQFQIRKRGGNGWIRIGTVIQDKENYQDIRLI